MISENRKIRFGVVGCGHIGKRHSEMIIRNEECELVAMCDVAARNTLKLDAYTAPFYNSLSEMLSNHPELDVVCVCSPNGFHAEHSFSCIICK